MTSLSADWLVSFAYIVLLFCCAAIMKSVNVVVAKPRGKELWIFLLLAPVLAVKTWRARASLTRKKALGALRKCCLFGSLLLVYHFHLKLHLHALVSNPVALAYIYLLPFWCLVETAGALTELSWAPFGIRMPPINQAPWLSRNAPEFWGKRWNRTFGDWFHQTCFRPLRRRPHVAMMFTFFLSGVIHEVLVSVPLWLVYGQNVFGWMMAFFALQALSVWLDRRFLRNPIIRRLSLWTFLLLPAPLLMNEGTQRVFHLVLS